VYFADPDKLSPLLLPINGPNAIAANNNLIGGGGYNSSKVDYAKLPAAITNGPTSLRGGGSHLAGGNHVPPPLSSHLHHPQQPHHLPPQHNQKVLLDAALDHYDQERNYAASKQPSLHHTNNNTHNTAATAAVMSPSESGWPLVPSSKLTPKEPLPPAADMASPLTPFGANSKAAGGAGAKYVLLSPMYGSRSLLLSPVIEAGVVKDGGGGNKQQSGFIILPVETLGPTDWPKEQT
jgi:hypothetical protein